MKYHAVKGTRDFYPRDMAIRNWIVDAWRRVSLRNGFEEYDGPIFEYLDLFRAKSGEGIVSELFHFTDRGERELAIRPEMTPTLARMIAAQAASLPRPIKWFSVPRLCRAERPQRGRLREFFQWNADIVGTDDVLADAECIFVVLDFFRDVAFTVPNDHGHLPRHDVHLGRVLPQPTREELAEYVAEFKTRFAAEPHTLYPNRWQAGYGLTLTRYQVVRFCDLLMRARAVRGDIPLDNPLFRRIDAWVDGQGGNRLVIDARFDASTGISVSRGDDSAEDVFSVRLVLERSNRLDTGYRIVTGYPSAP